MVLHRLYTVWILMNLCCVKTLALSVSSSLWFCEAAIILHNLCPPSTSIYIKIVPNQKIPQQKASLNGVTAETLFTETYLHSANLYSNFTCRWNYINYFHKLAKKYFVFAWLTWPFSNMCFDSFTLTKIHSNSFPYAKQYLTSMTTPLSSVEQFLE